VTVRDFCDKINTNWSSKRYMVKVLSKRVFKLNPFIVTLPLETLPALNVCKRSKNSSYRFLNFLKTIYFLDFKFKIKDITDIRKKMISSDLLVETIKSFIATLSEKRMKENPKRISFGRYMHDNDEDDNEI
jgi:hypothetical protein